MTYALTVYLIHFVLNFIRFVPWTINKEEHHLMTDSNNAVPGHHRRQFFRTKLNSDDVWNETWSISLETIPLQITFAKYVALEISNWFSIVPVQLHQYDGFNISTFDTVPMLRGFLKTLFSLCMSIYYILLSTTSCKKNQDLHKSRPTFFFA